MTPTLAGRLQTRWVMVWTIGLAWVLLVGPFLPFAGPTFAAVWSAGVASLVLVSVLGTINATVLVGPRIAYAMGCARVIPMTDRRYGYGGGDD